MVVGGCGLFFFFVMVVLDREHFARTVRGIFLSVGIFLSLVTYAYCQERIMTRPFLVSSSEAMFANTLFLVLVNRTFAVCAAAVVIVSTSGVAGLAPQAPLEKFPVVSVANLVATMCQYEALKWITLATQTLFKCSKLIPMMVLSTVLSRRKYSYVDYASAVSQRRKKSRHRSALGKERRTLTGTQRNLGFVFLRAPRAACGCGGMHRVYEG